MRVAFNEAGAGGLLVCGAVLGANSNCAEEVGEVHVHVLDAVSKLVAEDHVEHSPRNERTHEEGLALWVVEPEDAALVQIEEQVTRVDAKGDDAKGAFNPAKNTQILGSKLFGEFSIYERADTGAVNEIHGPLLTGRDPADGREVSEHGAGVGFDLLSSFSLLQGGGRVR